MMNVSVTNTTYQDIFIQSLQPVVSAETRHLVDIVVNVGLTTLICMVGVPANAITCLVFWRQGLKDRMNLCLFSLALVDGVYLTCMFAIQPVNFFIEWCKESNFETIYLQGYVGLVGVSYGCRSTSSFITMVIAIERCACVLFPLRVSTLMKTRTMGVLILLPFLFFQLSFITLPLSYYVVKIAIGDKVENIFLSTYFYNTNAAFITIFTHTCMGFVVPFAIFIVVSFTTAITGLKLKAALTWREKKSRTFGNNHQTALTVTLVIVSCIYIITMMPLVAREISTIKRETRR